MVLFYNSDVSLQDVNENLSSSRLYIYYHTFRAREDLGRDNICASSQGSFISSSEN